MAEAVTKTPFLGACQSSQRSLIKAQEVVSSTTRRSDADQLAIVMSGGVAYDVDQAVEEADKLKQLGARVMVIGVRSLNQRFLEMIASDPDDVYIVTDYGEAMTSLTVKIKTKICIIAPAFKSTANVLFVIDSSGSIGTANYAKELDFVVKVTSMFNVAVNAVNFSAITYSNSIIPLFGFDVATHQEIRRATLNAVYQAGGTPTAMALRRAGDILTSYSQVYRRDSKKIAIVITDGASDDPRATCEEAQRLQDIGIFVIAIGVAGAKREELEIIATSVEDVHDVDSFDALVTIKKNIGKNTKELENAVRASRQRVMPEVPTVFSVLSKVWPFK
ncbi:unnamed protein product [Lymnaea stagnalis]|uniref:VWFA domain-containing protein n=1 Tax=Lymnaea stagnalis TaxID=6523 RepID=A0AAV2HFI5_LYMST